MSYFFWGMLLLMICTAIYYIVFLALIYYWHERKTTIVIVPLLYTFEFFLVGFFVVAFLSIVMQYFPEIMNLLVYIFKG